MDEIISIKANTLEECFKEACYKIVENITKKENNSLIFKNNKINTKTIFAEGRDIKNLLYNLLEEVLFYFEEDNFLITDIKKTLCLFGVFRMQEKTFMVFSARKINDFPVIQNLKHKFTTLFFRIGF